MTGLNREQLADLTGRVREIVGHEWEEPPLGRPHVLPLPAAVVAVLFGLRQNMSDEVLAEVFGCSQATITRYHQILQPILRWVTRPEVDDRLEQAPPGGCALLDRRRQQRAQDERQLKQIAPPCRRRAALSEVT